MKEEERLRMLEKFLIVKMLRVVNKDGYKRVYFKFRKWHPVVVACFIFNLLCYTIKEVHSLIEEYKEDINKEKFIEVEEKTNK